MNSPLDATQALKALIDAARQAKRLLRLSFPRNDAPAGVLMVANKLIADEGLSRDFEYEVEVLSDSPDIAQKELVGKMVTVELQRNDGSVRYFNGYIHILRFIRNDAGFSVYEIVIKPWFAFLSLRKDNYLFHGKSVEEQTNLIFADYEALRDWRIESLGADEVMTDACQWDESDQNYLHRRWQARGWHYWYEHRKDGHTLVLSGDSTQSKPIDGVSSDIAWRGKSGLKQPGIETFSPVRSVASTLYSAASFDFKNPRPSHAQLPSANEQGQQPELEVYEYAGAYPFKDQAAGDDFVRRRMEQIEAAAKHFEATGDDPRAQPRRVFTLSGHLDLSVLDPSNTQAGQNDFVILSVVHTASNNYEASTGGVAQYSNTLTCIRKKIPWRPARGFNSFEPKIYGLQTALVVGPSGDTIHTDPYGRVRVQFHWDRLGAYDEQSSAWVRVASNWAGGEKGLASHPRIGSEVIVQFLDGNPDRPLITGGVHNEHYMPPWKLPEQQALTGLRSRELSAGGGNAPGGRSNHLVLDDTQGKIQAQLKSDHLTSQLSLGHVHRIEDNAGRKDARGEGFELRTDGHGALRAQKGLLITTEARAEAQAHITDITETVDGLKDAQAQHDNLSNTAQQAKAHESGDQDAVVKSLDEQATALQGQGSTPSGGKPDGKFPEFEQPHLTLASPVGIQTHSGGATHIASATHNALTSGAHTSISAGKSLLVSAKEAVRLFAYNAGMKLIAASGDIDITTLKNSVNILAKLNITQTADTITIAAKQKVEINGGTSYSRWSASGIEHGTSGVWTQKASSFSAEGPDNAPGPQLPDPITFTDAPQLVHTQRLAFALKSHVEGGRTFANEPYALYKNGAKVADGVTDEHGQLIIEKHTPGTPAYAVELSNGAKFDLPVSDQIAPDDEAKQRSNLGYRGPKGADSRSDDYGSGDASA